MVLWENLTVEQSTKVHEIMRRHGVADRDAYLCFWPEGDAWTGKPGPTVKVDGDLNLAELRALVECLEYLAGK